MIKLFDKLHKFGNVAFSILWLMNWDWFRATLIENKHINFDMDIYFLRNSEIYSNL